MSNQKRDRVTADQIAELLRQDKSGRVTRGLLQAFLMDPSRAVGQPLEGYPVVIDYSATNEDLVAGGLYDELSHTRLIHGSDPFRRDHKHFRNQQTIRRRLELVCLNRELTTEEVEAELEHLGLRPAELEELLAFGTFYPEVQLKCRIIALGSGLYHESGRTQMPSLWSSNGSKRVLGYIGKMCFHRWSKDIFFLATRK